MTTTPLTRLAAILAAATVATAPSSLFAHPGHVGPHLAQPGVGAVVGTLALAMALTVLSGPGRRLGRALRRRRARA